MKFLDGLCCAFGLISLASADPAWKLDKTCKTSETSDMVVKAVESAFNMAQGELDAITKAVANEDLGENGDNIRNVIKWMFMKDDEGMDKSRVNVLKANLGHLVKAKDRNDDADPDTDTIVVYCGFDRFEKRQDGNWYDGDIKEVLKKSESFEDCQGASPNVAYTLVPDNHSKPSQVQLCPWFLDWMKQEDTKKLKDAKIKGNFWKYLSKAMVKLHVVLSPVDVASLLDKVILHELSHTRNAGKSLDVDEGSLATVRYGWKRCRELAQKGSRDHDQAAQFNADSIALCGSAIRFIKEGKEVKENGDVDKR